MERGHLLLVVFVRLEEINEAGEQIDLWQVEQGVVHIDPLLIKLQLDLKVNSGRANMVGRPGGICLGIWQRSLQI